MDVAHPNGGGCRRVTVAVVFEEWPVAARLNRLPALGVHRLAVVVVGLGLVFVLYEVSLVGTLAAVLRHDFQMGSRALAVVLASGFAGQEAEALVAAWEDEATRRIVYRHVACVDA